MDKLERKKKIHLWLFCFITAFLVLLVASNNSFLYKFNDWIDINWYITMGEGVLDGKVIYRDLYEQKGPLTYFVFAFLALFNNIYYAVFILEVVCLTITLFLAHKLFSKFLSPMLSLIGIMLLALIITCGPFFVVGGGAVEEYGMPIFMYFLLLLFDFMENKTKLSYRKSVLLGALISVLFWIKYTMIVLPACVMIVWLVMEFKNKNFKSALMNILFMFVGFMIVTLPILLYFVANGALGDLMITYFYNNLFRYKSKPDLIGNIGYIVLLGAFTFIFNIVGMIHTKKQYGKRGWIYIGVLLTYLLSLIIFDCCVYYFLPTTIFTLMGIVAMLSKAGFIQLKTTTKNIVVIIALLVTFGSTFLFANGIYEMGRDKSEYAQFSIAQDIKVFNLKDPTLFCYRMYDYGMYTTCGIRPNEKYFARNNFTKEELPEMYEAFEAAIREQRNDFVVVQKKVYNEDKELLEEYYDCYKEYSYHYIESTFSTHKEEFILMIKSV